MLYFITHWVAYTKKNNTGSGYSIVSIFPIKKCYPGHVTGIVLYLFIKTVRLKFFNVFES